MSPKSPGPGDIVAEIQGTLDRLIAETQNPISSSNRRSLDKSVRMLIKQFEQVLDSLDPVLTPTSIFDPGDPKVVGRFIALALVAQRRESLSLMTPFYGSGVYAIYYVGQYPAYLPLSNSETPIYVGQAAPKTPHARTPSEQGDKLYSRLKDHRKNITKASATLELSDFHYRTLVVQSGWEASAEDYLIQAFTPIWNNETKLVYGLGKHGDSAATRANRRSPWDVLHEGRLWAGDERIEDAKSREQIEAELRLHFMNNPVYKDLDEVLRRFIEQLRQI